MTEFERLLLRDRRQRDAAARLHRARNRREGRRLRPIARRWPRREQVRLPPVARDRALSAGRFRTAAGHDAGHFGRRRGNHARRGPRARARPPAPDPPPVPRPAAQRRAAQRRRRRHQRQVDRDRHDRLDPARAPPPADRHERRGDEEFRHAFGARSPARWSAIPELFVSEVDESDGSIALYQPEVAVLTNISLDHKEMAELRSLFAGLPAACARKPSSTSTIRKRGRWRTSSPRRQMRRLRLRQPGRGRHGQESRAAAGRTSASPSIAGDERHDVQLSVPGRHNASNALAAIAATRALGVSACRCRCRDRPLRRPEAPARNGRRRRPESL